jgi:hypothetical protein
VIVWAGERDGEMRLLGFDGVEGSSVWSDECQQKFRWRRAVSL